MGNSSFQLGKARLPFRSACTLTAAAAVLIVSAGCNRGGGEVVAGKVKDEAMSAVPPRLADSFAFADEDFFHDMDQTKDGPLALTPNQIRGRNMWLVWTAGDDSLWDTLK